MRGSWARRGAPARRFPRPRSSPRSPRRSPADGYPWTDIYQAYHRLLAYHEHTNAIDFIAPNRERMRRYETELEENREMVAESQEFARHAPGRCPRQARRRDHRAGLRTHRDRLQSADPRSGPTSSSIADDEADRCGDRLVDVSTGREVPWQTMPDGTVAFVAADVPSLGYRTYAIAGGRCVSGDLDRLPASNTVLENRFYRITFDCSHGRRSRASATRNSTSNWWIRRLRIASTSTSTSDLKATIGTCQPRGTAPLPRGSRHRGTGRRRHDGVRQRRGRRAIAADGRAVPRSQAHRLRAGPGQITVRPARHDSCERPVWQGIGLLGAAAGRARAPVPPRTARLRGGAGRGSVRRRLHGVLRRAPLQRRVERTLRRDGVGARQFADRVRPSAIVPDSRGGEAPVRTGPGRRPLPAACIST